MKTPAIKEMLMQVISFYTEMLFLVAIGKSAFSLIATAALAIFSNIFVSSQMSASIDLLRILS